MLAFLCACTTQRQTRLPLQNSSQRKLRQTHCFWLIDANAEPGHADDEAVYGKGLRTSANTIFFRECLKTCAMCLPSTSNVHAGHRNTWTKPDGEESFCIDYVAIPRTWISCCTWSQVLDDFDLATTREDHKAVRLELQWWQPKRMPHVEWSSSAIQQSEQECRDVAGTQWPSHTAVPRTFGKDRVFLHMFAGGRRRGDVQFFLGNIARPATMSCMW